jgi:hypothetical protein
VIPPSPARLERLEAAYRTRPLPVLSRTYQDMLRTEPAGMPAYEMLDRVRGVGLGVAEHVLQDWWDSLIAYRHAVDAMRAVLATEGLSTDDPDLSWSPATLRLLTRSTSLMNIWSRAAIAAFARRAAAWIAERRATLRAMERECAATSLEGVLAAQAALVPLAALSDGIDPATGAGLVAFHDVAGRKIGGWVR